MLQEKFFKRSSYSFGTVYGPPPSSYDQKVRAEQALNNDMEVDQATSRGTSKDDPANPAVDGPRNPRKADPQSPGSNSRKRLPWIIGGVAAMVLLAIVVWAVWGK